MKNKKTEDDIINYRLEKINKIKKNPAKKGFHRLFEDKNINPNISNFADGSLSQKIFNKSGNKKNVTLRMLDFEQDFPSVRPEEKGTQFVARIKFFSYFLAYLCRSIVLKVIFYIHNFYFSYLTNKHILVVQVSYQKI